jgi:hypothetical protein
MEWVANITNQTIYRMEAPRPRNGEEKVSCGAQRLRNRGGTPRQRNQGGRSTAKAEDGMGPRLMTGFMWSTEAEEVRRCTKAGI